MRLWQRFMIGLARNRTMTTWAQSSRLMRPFARQFVGGRDLSQAMERTRTLRGEGLAASLFYLGEYVASEELERENVTALHALLPALAAAGLPLHVSVDPTQIGAMRSWDACRDEALRLAGSMAELLPESIHTRPGTPPAVLMLDMEDAGVTQRTLDLYHLLRDRGLPAAVTVQAYLFRTRKDLLHLIERGAWVRLVKGAFAEPAAIAHTGREARDAAYRAALETLFSEEARERGVRPVIGSHDHRMIGHADRLATARGWSRGQWEVEMLLGVRPDYQRALVAQGFSVRVYLPFGRDWWPYSIRRVGETPRNLGFVLRSLFGRG